MKLLLILGVSLTFLTAILHLVTMINLVHIKVMCFLAHHFLSIIYNTHFPHHILIKGGYNNNLVQTSHSFPSKIVFVPLFYPFCNYIQFQRMS